MLRNRQCSIMAAAISCLRRLFSAHKDRNMVLRIAKLRKVLAEVKVDIETRQFLVNLAFTNGRYCTSLGILESRNRCQSTMLIDLSHAILRELKCTMNSEQSVDDS
jgi:hypothetical protein